MELKQGNLTGTQTWNPLSSNIVVVFAGLRLNNAWASGTVLRPFLQPESPLSSRSLVSGFKCKLRYSNSRPPYSRPRALTTRLYTIHISLLICFNIFLFTFHLFVTCIFNTINFIFRNEYNKSSRASKSLRKLLIKRKVGWQFLFWNEMPLVGSALLILLTERSERSDFFLLMLSFKSITTAAKLMLQSIHAHILYFWYTLC